MSDSISIEDIKTWPTTGPASRRAGLSEARMRQLAVSGAIRTITIGRGRLYDPAACDKIRQDRENGIRKVNRWLPQPAEPHS